MKRPLTGLVVVYAFGIWLGSLVNLTWAALGCCARAADAVTSSSAAPAAIHGMRDGGCVRPFSTSPSAFSKGDKKVRAGKMRANARGVKRLGRNQSGMWNAECGVSRQGHSRFDLPLRFRIPHSAIRIVVIPQSAFRNHRSSRYTPAVPRAVRCHANSLARRRPRSINTSRSSESLDRSSIAST